MTTKELIDRYGIVPINGTGNIQATRGALIRTDNAQDEIRSRKAEILAYFQTRDEDRERAHKTQAAKIAAIDGLRELQAAIEAVRKYNGNFRKMMEDEYNDGIFPPEKPSVNLDDLRARYPRAAAYLRAESWTFASNSAKNSAGRKALNRIIEGEDYAAAIADMEKEFDQYLDEQRWD